MAKQEDVDRLTAKVGTIGEGVERIRQDFADFKAANPGVDVGALEASIDSVGADVAELDGEYPAEPAPEPTPEPDPEPVDPEV